MAKYYSLLPLPQGQFAIDELTLVDRAVFGMIYDRWRLSCYNATGSAAYETPWYDETREEFYCIFAHDELARLVGVSEKTIRRSLEKLRGKDYIDWVKREYMGANRYFIGRQMQEYMASLRKDSREAAKSP